ncbi:MAG: hypothetical protein E7639_06735 [Ruminococcaceae bacterium]|nr:hypothetical protein [Oscillospiraceae bacterium]
MKTWKMLLCLLLLCGIICGCAVVGAEAQTAEEDEVEGEKGGEGTSSLPPSSDEQSTEGSVTLSPTYSEGLAFRSNGDGTCAVSGVGSCTSTCILIPPKSPAGDTVIEVLPYAFSGSIVGAIEIPTTVKVLSAASFSGCTRLRVLRVAAGNEHFSEYDGVLYSADGCTLLYCPQGRGSGELRLHTALRRIAAGAFANCTGLGTVVYQGSTAAWHGVIVGDDNDALYAAGFRFAT